MDRALPCRSAEGRRDQSVIDWWLFPGATANGASALPATPYQFVHARSLLAQSTVGGGRQINGSVIMRQVDRNSEGVILACPSSALTWDNVAMPLVRIDLRHGKSPEYRRQIGDMVYRAMRETINIPEHDRFQVITERPPDGLLYDPSFLGINRTDGIVFIQITLNVGRTLEQKKALYARIAELLANESQIRPEDVLINLVECAKEDWSFGNGIASYAS
jgi:phenylpyruvate tautomerase PptA (4-oxalocrotonate tautomerase family)